MNNSDFLHNFLIIFYIILVSSPDNNKPKKKYHDPWEQGFIFIYLDDAT